MQFTCNLGPILIPFGQQLKKKPNVNSTREQPLTTVIVQEPLDETHCFIQPLPTNQIWQMS